MARTITVTNAVNANVKNFSTVDLDDAKVEAGQVPSAVSAYVVATELGDLGGVTHQTLLTITDLPITMRDTEQGGGAQVYTFPAGRILQMGATSSIAVTTTSVLADTLNTGVTCNYGVGSVTQANATVATTEQDFVQVAAFTASATVGVAGATATGSGLADLTSLDGTSTAIAAFLNLAVASATDIDADATTTVTGTIRITWANLGDY